MASAPFTEVVVVKAARAAVGVITVCGSRGCGEGGGSWLHRRSRWGWVVQGLVMVAASLTQIVARW